MPFKKFDEYLDGKGKLVEKPEVTPTADYTGPSSKSPEKSGDWVIKNGKAPKIPGVGQGKPGDYQSTAKPWTQDKCGPNAAPEKGLVEKGLKAVKYPKNTMPKEAPAKELFKKPKDAYPAGAKGPWTMKEKKTKTEMFIDKTSKMSLSEFTKYMLSECACEDMAGGEDDSIPTVTSYAAGKFHPHPPEAIKYVVHLCKKNPQILDSLVHELKRADVLPKAIEASLDHPEGVDAVVDILGDDEKGPKHAGKLARSMSSKYHKFMDDQDDMYESVAPPYAGFEDDDDEEHGEPDDSENGPSLNGQDMEPDEGGEDHGDSDTDQNHDLDHDEDGEEPGNKEGPPDPDEGLEDMKPEHKPKKLKKKFAHDHLLDAMSEHGHMREKMKGY